MWNIQRAGLVVGSNRAGSASSMSAQSGTEERTPSRLRRIPSGPKADGIFFEKQTQSGPKANPGTAFGVRLVLGWVRLVL